MRLLILRKQTCLAGPLRCRRTWKMLLKTQSLLLGFKALLCLLSSLPRLLGTEIAATPRTTALQGGGLQKPEDSPHEPGSESHGV